MRSAFATALLELADKDERVFLVVGDVGFGVVEAFLQRYPDRYLNVGVAEANLVGVSAGLALAGAVPFAYSIGNFPTLRCLEQIRNDVCYNNANLKIVAVGAGVSYGALGATHHATEDLAVMRALPNMIVVSPADPIETRLATLALMGFARPAYMRLGRSGDPMVHSKAPSFALGTAITIEDGGDATLIATGGITHTALAAAELLRREGTNLRVVSMHTLKPLDRSAVVAAALDTGAIVTIEEHRITGGLGSAVLEALAAEKVWPRSFAMRASTMLGGCSSLCPRCRRRSGVATNSTPAKCGTRTRLLHG